MAYTIMQLALTIDNCIARIDGSVDFLGEIEPSFNETFNAFIDSIDTILMGRNTYDKMLEFGEIPFSNKQVIVVTSKPATSTYSHVTFVQDTVKNIITSQKGRVWLFGGSKLFSSCLEEDLIDEMQLYIVPYVIGEGIPLFNTQSHTKKFTLMNHQQFGDNIYLTYKKIREEE